MFKLKAAQRLLAEDIGDHREEDEQATDEFMNVAPTVAADTPAARDQRDVVPYMFARKLAAQYRKHPLRPLRPPHQQHAQGDLLQNQMQHPRTHDLDLLTSDVEHSGAMGDNTAETDPLMQNYENSNPRYKSGIAADSTADTPFDDFGNAEVPNDMYLEDQPDIVRAAPRKKRKTHPKKPHTKSKSNEMLKRLLDEQSVMYQNEASSDDSDFNVSTGGEKFTYNSDNQPGSVHVRFPISDSPTDGSSYMHVRGHRSTAGWEDHDLDTHEMLGEPSEPDEVHIFSNTEEPAEEQEVLSDADPKVLWNVANQPLS
jgi:hypothetical protein